MRRRLALGIGVAVLVTALGLWAVLPDVASDVPGREDLVVDKALLQETMDRLRSVRPEVDALTVPALQGASSKSRLQSCYIDSGTPGQPWFGRSWSVRRGVAPEASEQLATAFIGSGWKSEATSPGGSRRLLRSFDGWDAIAYVGDFADVDDGADVAVYVDVRVAEARPCSLASEQ